MPRWRPVARRLAGLCAIQYPFLSRLNPVCPGHDATPSRNASTDGPAPDTTAGTPAARSRPTRSCVAASPAPGSPGAAGPRWRRAARPARAVSAATSSAARPALRAASACGTAAGSSPRATLVETGCRGDERDRRDLARAARSRTACAARSPAIQAMVRPPNRQGATLSGCPSSSLASGSTSLGSTLAPGQRARRQHAGHDRGRRRAEAAPVRYPVHAAQREARRLADAQVVERDPHRAHHQVLFPGVRDVGGALAGHLDRHARTASPAPRPRRAGSSASPSASKPGPRFALVAGTRTSTGSLSPPHATSPHRPVDVPFSCLTTAIAAVAVARLARGPGPRRRRRRRPGP